MKLDLKFEFTVPDEPHSVRRLNEIAKGMMDAAQTFKESTEGAVLRVWAIGTLDTEVS